MRFRSRLVFVAQVDPEDDSILRYVVRHYAYDPRHHERRHQVVAAFDNDREFHELITTLADQLRQRRSTGARTDREESVSGVVLEPGHRRRQQNARLLQRAIRRGVTLSDAFLARLDLPSNVGIMRF